MDFIRTFFIWTVALLMAGLLALLVYVAGWWLALRYAEQGVQSVLGGSMGAQVTYAQPQWQPRWREVAVQLPRVHVVWQAGGPLRAFEANNVMLVTGFFRRDAWRLELPATWQLTLANGQTLQGQSTSGVVGWQADGTLRVQAARLALPEVGLDLTKLAVALGNGPQARVQLASRSGSFRLGGELTLPQPLLAKVLTLWANQPGMGLGAVLQAAWQQLPAGGQVQLTGVNFQSSDTVQGALDGRLTKQADGRATGSLLMSANRVPQLLAWLNFSGVVQPRSILEQMAWEKFARGLASPGVRLETSAQGLLVNGLAVGPLPDVGAILGRI
jgi:hypothetical protein